MYQNRELHYLLCGFLSHLARSGGYCLKVLTGASPVCFLSPSLEAVTVSHLLWTTQGSLSNVKFCCCSLSAPYWQFVTKTCFSLREKAFTCHDFNMCSFRFRKPAGSKHLLLIYSAVQFASLLIQYIFYFLVHLEWFIWAIFLSVPPNLSASSKHQPPCQCKAAALLSSRCFSRLPSLGGCVCTFAQKQCGCHTVFVCRCVLEVICRVLNIRVRGRKRERYNAPYCWLLCLITKVSSSHSKQRLSSLL